jgi:DNA transformation protein
MADASPLVDYLVDQLLPLGQARGRRMFGGHGLYLDGLFVGIVADETLYLKADDATQPAFAAAGMAPFSYSSRGRRISLSFWETPVDVLEDPQALCRWVADAAAAARRGRAARAPRKPRAKRASPPRPAR